MEFPVFKMYNDTVDKVIKIIVANVNAYEDIKFSLNNQHSLLHKICSEFNIRPSTKLRLKFINLLNRNIMFQNKIEGLAHTFENIDILNHITKQNDLFGVNAEVNTSDTSPTNDYDINCENYNKLNNFIINDNEIPNDNNFPSKSAEEQCNNSKISNISVIEINNYDELNYQSSANKEQNVPASYDRIDVITNIENFCENKTSRIDENATNKNINDEDIVMVNSCENNGITSLNDNTITDQEKHEIAYVTMCNELNSMKEKRLCFENYHEKVLF